MSKLFEDHRRIRVSITRLYVILKKSEKNHRVAQSLGYPVEPTSNTITPTIYAISTETQTHRAHPRPHWFFLILPMQRFCVNDKKLSKKPLTGIESEKKIFSPKSSTDGQTDFQKKIKKNFAESIFLRPNFRVGKRFFTFLTQV